ncbi:MAG: DUF3592 domain-containing protein [Candidatus Sericytochromatia bacterium]
MPVEPAFLMNPRNAPAAAGEVGRLASEGPPMGCLGLFWAPFMVAGLMVLGGAIDECVRYGRLMLDGATTTAVVLDRRAGRNEAGGGTLTYRYAVPPAAPVTQKEPVSRARFEAYPPGASVSVRYWKPDPELAEIDREGRMRIQMPFFIGFALFWNLIAWGAGWAIAREARRLGRLRRHGARLAGHLVRCAIERDDDGDCVVVADYQFTTPAGRTLVGSQRASRPDMRDVPTPVPGTPVWVAYADDAHFQLM